MLLISASDTLPGKPSSGKIRVRPATMMIVAIALIALGMGLLVKWPAYKATSVCRLCAERRDHFACEARFSKIVFFQFSRVTPTLVSRVFAKNGSLPPHQHIWTEPAAMDTSLSADGGSAPNLLYVVDAARVVRFSEELSRNSNLALVRKWKEITLDPRNSTIMESSLHFMRYPEKGFGNDESFRRWWQSAEYPLWNRLRELTEPD